MRTVLAIATLMLEFYPATAQDAQHTMINADQVQWKEAPPILPGAQAAVLYGDPAKEDIFVMRIKFPANYRVPPHTHPVDEVVTVISGEFNLGMGEKFNATKTSAYTAGGLIAMPSETPHFVHTDEEAVVQLRTRGPGGLKYFNPDDKAGVSE